MRIFKFLITAYGVLSAYSAAAYSKSDLHMRKKNHYTKEVLRFILWLTCSQLFFALTIREDC